MVLEGPKGWRLDTLANLSHQVKRGAAPSYATEPTGINAISQKCVRDGVIDLSVSRPHDPTKSVPEKALLQPGDVCVNSTGTGTLGRVALWEHQGGHYFADTHVTIVRPDKSKIEPFFLAAFLGSPPTTETIYRECVTGSTNQIELSAAAFSQLAVPVPPLDEQRQIADVLRSVDEAIGANQEQRRQSQSLRIALLNQYFHMGDWSDGAPLPAGWNLLLLDQLAVRGSGHTPNKKVAEYWDGNIKWVSLQDTKRLDKIFISETAQTISDQGLANSSAVLHPDGIVVVSRDATVGKSAITVGPMAVSQHFIAYRCGPSLDRLYLYYWLQRMKPVFERIGAGSTIKTIGLPFFKALRIALPPLEHQKEMASALLDLDLSITACEKSLRSLATLKFALMSDLLSGRVRTYAPVAAAAKSVPRAFKRAVFAAEIVHQLHNDGRFGSVKHEKIVHLCELHLGLQDVLDRHAYKEAAGPYDPKARRSVERIFQQQKWFSVTKIDGKRVTYVPSEKVGGHVVYFDRYFGDQKVAIQSIIDLLRPLNTEQCEIVATLYAVWNDFLIDKRQPTDQQIIASVLQWHPKKQEIPEERWRAALPWMREKGLVPKGIGEKTRTARG